MSVDTTIAVLYAQTGLGTQFAHAAAVTPHAQAALTRVFALETQKQEQHLIEKTNETEEKDIKKDGRQKQSNIPFNRRRRMREKKSDSEDESVHNLPFTGNLLNLTV
ncbi:MAG: hypothetical protein K5657_00120 [Desulfovibrio sp.]|nr:hypothetical protein [Desulfovibrio sp.]